LPFLKRGFAPKNIYDCLLFNPIHWVLKDHNSMKKNFTYDFEEFRIDFAVKMQTTSHRIDIT
jgi:hypothetical protein